MVRTKHKYLVEVNCIGIVKADNIEQVKRYFDTLRGGDWRIKVIQHTRLDLSISRIHQITHDKTGKYV